MRVSRKSSEVNLPLRELSGIVELNVSAEGKPMTNDAKLGMVAGVVGVIVAAVLLSNAPPPAAQSKPGTVPEAIAKEKLAAQPSSPGPGGTATEGSPAALSSTPVIRTRKDVDAQPASRPSGTEEEP
jgi:hypothetical protein